MLTGKPVKLLYPYTAIAQRLEASMYRRHRRYRHKSHWMGWIIVMFIFFGVFGKAGFFFPFIFPFLIFFLLKPLFALATSFDQPRREQRWDQINDWLKEDRSVQPQPPPSPVRMEPARPPQPVRSMAGLPGTCSACGGPVTSTTVDWYGGNQAHCGYCGTALRK